MIREVALEDISDGKLYDGDDLVKVNCHDCIGCDKCCHGMGDTIVLDTYDAYSLTTGLGVTMAELLQDNVELGMADGLILPHLKMQEGSGSCGFLDAAGRCSVHPFRPGICRLFPLGRYYEGENFRYFLQKGECPKENRTKIKVKQWLGIPEFRKYETFVRDWHGYIKKKQAEAAASEEDRKAICMELLQRFYLTPYEKSDFYLQFYDRMQI